MGRVWDGFWEGLGRFWDGFGRGLGEIWKDFERSGRYLGHFWGSLGCLLVLGCILLLFVAFGCFWQFFVVFCYLILPQGSEVSEQSERVKLSGAASAGAEKCF